MTELKRLEKQKDRKLYLLAFIIPLLISGLFLFIGGIIPFGNKSPTVIDAYHQYISFMHRLKTNLSSFDLSTFSWENGLGVATLPEHAYYTASPLNVLLLFFKDINLQSAFTLIMVIKNSLASLFMAYYLNNAYERKVRPINLSLSVAYAASTFSLAYFWNIMWTDVVLLLPLLAISFVYWVRDNSPIPMILTIALTLYTNFYMAGFSFAFMIFFYFLSLSRYKVKFESLGARLGHFVKTGANAVIGIAIPAFLWFPTFYRLIVAPFNDNSMVAQGVDITRNIGSMLEALSNYFMPLGIDHLEPELPLFVSIAVIFGIFLTVKSKKLKASEKAIRIVPLILIPVLTNNDFFDYVFNMLRRPAQLPYRYIYTIAFLGLDITYEVFKELRFNDLRRREKQTLNLAVVASSLFLVILNHNNPSVFTYGFVFLNMGLLLSLRLVMGLNRREVNLKPENSEKQSKKKFSLSSFAKKVNVTSIVAIVLIAQSFLTIGIISNNNKVKYSFGTAFSVDSDCENDLVSTKELRLGVRDLLDKAYGDSTEFKRYNSPANNFTGLNSEIFNNHYGLNYFSSTAPYTSATHLHLMGFTTNDLNSYYMAATTGMPLEDFLLGVHYNVRDEYKAKEELQKITVVQGEVQDNFYTEKFRKSLPTNTDEDRFVSLYENKHKIPPFYLIANDANFVEIDNLLAAGSENYDSGFDYRNELFKQITNQNENVYDKLELKFFPENEVLLVDESNTNNVQVWEGGPDGASFTTVTKDAGYYFIEQDSSKTFGANNFTLEVNGEPYDTFYEKANYKTLPLGYFEADTILKFSFFYDEDPAPERYANYCLTLARLNNKVFENGANYLETLNKNTKVEVDGSKAFVEYDAIGNQKMILTIPAQEGFTAKVNNEKLDIKSLDNIFLITDVPAGKNTLELKYNAPLFKEGVIITFSSLIVLALILWFEKRNTPKKDKGMAFSKSEQTEENIEERRI